MVVLIYKLDIENLRTTFRDGFIMWKITDVIQKVLDTK